MFKFDPESFYMMPAHFGPRFRKGSAFYGDLTTIAISYLTDRKLLARYLPEPFEVGLEPLVSVSYAMNREIEWLAGGCYNIVGVNVSASDIENCQRAYIRQLLEQEPIFYSPFVSPKESLCLVFPV